MSELSAIAGRAVEAALAAGAGDAEAYAVARQRPRGPRPRRRGREPDRGDPARHRRPRLDRRPGRLRLRHRPLRGRRRGDRRPRRRGGARSPTRTSSRRRRSRPRSRRWPGSSDPSVAAWTTARGGRAGADGRAHRAGRRPARHRGRAGRLRRLRRAGRDRLLDRRRRRVRVLRAASPTCRPWPRATEAARPGSASASPAAPPASTRRRSARGGRARDGDDRRRQARLAHLPGRPRPDRRRQLRRPDRRRPRRRRRPARPLARSPTGSARSSPARRSSSTTTAATPAGPASAPVRRRGRAAPPHGADRGRPPARLPLRHLHGQPRGRRLDRQRRPRTATARCPRSPPRTWSSPPAPLSFEELLGEAGDGVYVTDVAGLHSGVNPVTGVFSVGASGRAIRGGELAEPLREFTIASDLVSMLGAVRAAGAEARWVPFGGSVSTPPLLIGEMAVSGS